MIAAAHLLFLTGGLLLFASSLWTGLWGISALVLMATAAGLVCLHRPVTSARIHSPLIVGSAISGISMTADLPAWIPIASICLFLFSWNTTRIQRFAHPARLATRDERRAAGRLLVGALALTAATSASVHLALHASLILPFGAALLLAAGALAALGAFFVLLRRQIVPPGR